MRFIPAVSPVQIQVPLPGPKDGPWPSFGAHFKQGPLGQLGPLVKWLRHRPFTAVTRVRVSYGSPIWRRSSAGRALASHARGHRFEFCRLHQKTTPFGVVFLHIKKLPLHGKPLCAAALSNSSPWTGELPRRARLRGRPLAIRRKTWYFKAGAAQTAGGWPHAPHAETRKGGEAMRITLHIGPFTVTIIVKSRNRHSAK